MTAHSHSHTKGQRSRECHENFSIDPGQGGFRIFSVLYHVEGLGTRVICARCLQGTALYSIIDLFTYPVLYVSASCRRDQARTRIESNTGVCSFCFPHLQQN